MAIGKLKHKLHIQTQTRTSDGGGSQAVSYSDSFSVFGSIMPKTGSERLFGDQLEERITHIITTRFNRNITFKNRIQYRLTKKVLLTQEHLTSRELLTEIQEIDIAISL